MGFTAVYAWAEYQLENDLEPNLDTNVNSDGLNLLKFFRFPCQRPRGLNRGHFFSLAARIPKKWLQISAYSCLGY